MREGLSVVVVGEWLSVVVWETLSVVVVVVVGIQRIGALFPEIKPNTYNFSSSILFLLTLILPFVNLHIKKVTVGEP